MSQSMEGYSTSPGDLGTTLSGGQQGGAAAVPPSASPPPSAYAASKQSPVLLDTPAPAAAAPGNAPAPAAYALTLPESAGGEIISPEDLAEFSRLAQGSSLSNDQAQAVINYAAQRNTEALESQGRMRAQWEQSVRADREMGGDRLTATVMTANQAIKMYDTSGTISQLLHDSGYGSHPDIIRFLYNVGKSLNEDSIPGHGSSGRAELPLEERLYPN